MDPRVTELHCIMPIDNVASVLKHGILSYDRAAKLPHHSVAMQPVQERRDHKHVPGGLPLHRYANLYIHARNPMLYKRLYFAASLCVLRVELSVLSVAGAVLSDCNAASDYVRFYPPTDWAKLPFDDILAMDWTHPGDPARFYQHKSRKCAEALIPHRVDPAYIRGAYVSDQAVSERLAGAVPSLPISINGVLFFRQG